MAINLCSRPGSSNPGCSNPGFSHKSAGLSLIEVMVAMLVLATGMLALASLQGGLVRNSVDARNRSFAQSVAASKLERLRDEVAGTGLSYEALDLAPIGGAPLGGTHPLSQRLKVNPSTATNPAGTDQFVNETGVAGNFAPGVADAGAAETYTWELNVTRFVRESNSAVCVLAGAQAPCFRPSNNPAVTTGINKWVPPTTGVAEFKRLDVTIRWKDAAGVDRTSVASDLVGTTTDDQVRNILNQTGRTSAGVGNPTVRIPKPTEGGIIPIAIGGDKETAASNPKPVTGRERGRTDETQFQVLTYSNGTDGGATVNRLVDTRVIGCRCNLQAASSVVDQTTFLKIPVQPTYWDRDPKTGEFFYLEPSAPGDVTAGYRGAPVDGAAQSSLCTTCCLDHHDRVGNKIAFDPLRQEGPSPAWTPLSLIDAARASDPSKAVGAEHKHYSVSLSGSTVGFAEAKVNEEYAEVCRMIRVNGTFRVATDMYEEQSNLLDHDPTYATGPAPIPAKITRYQDMVKDYIKMRVVDGQPRDTAVANLSPSFDDILKGDPWLGDPPQIFLALDAQYSMHDRGLYLDFLETNMRKALDDVVSGATCKHSDGTAATVDDKVNCALAIMPLVAINTTPVAQWTSSKADSAIDNHVTVTNWNLQVTCPKNNPTCSLPPTNRGSTAAKSTGVEDGIVAQQASNTGVSDSLPVDPHDQTETLGDVQPFSVGPSCASAGNFRVILSGISTAPEIPFEPATVQSVFWENPLETDPSVCGIKRGGLCSGAVPGPNPFTCVTGFPLPPLTAQVVLNLGGYNRIIDATTTPVARMVNPGSCSTVPVGQNICQNWTVADVTVPGLPSPVSAVSAITYTNEGQYTYGPGLPGESVEIKINSTLLTPGVALTASLKLESEKEMGAYCDATGQVVQPPCP